MEIMKDDLDAVYDVTVAYEGTLDSSGQRKRAPSMAGEFDAPSEVLNQEGPYGTFFRLLLKCQIKQNLQAVG